jgi:hypothetical protein
MGEFLVQLALSSKGIDDKKVWTFLIKEYIARQVYWVIDKLGGRFNSLNFDI